jgi:hypothetical protein
MTNLRYDLGRAVGTLAMIAALAAVATPAFADRDDHHDRDRGRHEHWRHHDHPQIVYGAPGYPYSPPPVVYAPAPQPSGLALMFNIR